MLWLGQSRHSQEFCASSRSCDAGGRVCPNWGEHGGNEDAGALFAQLLQMCISGVSLMPFLFEKKKSLRSSYGKTKIDGRAVFSTWL